MKKSFMVATILVIVVSMFIGCALPTGIPGGTGENGETAGHTSGSSTEDVTQDTDSTEDVSQDTSTKDIAQDIRKMLIVPEEVEKIVDAAMDLFVGEDQWVNFFDLGFWYWQAEVKHLWAINFYIETSKEPADKQFHKMAEILKGFGYPQEDIHLKLGEQRKELELHLSSERKGRVEDVYVSYNPEDLEIHIMVSFDPSDTEAGLDVDKGDSYDWSCTNDVANMLGINIKNILEGFARTVFHVGEGYNNIHLSIRNFKDQKSPIFELDADGLLGRSRIENVVDKVEMVGDIYGGSYSMSEGDDLFVTLEDARCDNNSFNVFFSTGDSYDELTEVILGLEFVVK